MRNWIPIVLLDKGLKRDEKGWLTVLFFSTKALPAAFHVIFRSIHFVCLFACHQKTASYKLQHRNGDFKKLSAGSSLFLKVIKNLPRTQVKGYFILHNPMYFAIMFKMGSDAFQIPSNLAKGSFIDNFFRFRSFQKIANMGTIMGFLRIEPALKIVVLHCLCVFQCIFRCSHLIYLQRIVVCSY